MTSAGPITKGERGFSRDAAAELGWLKDEPDWLREQRLQAWQAWETLPMPGRRDDEWRRTDLRRLDLSRPRAFQLEDSANGDGAGLTELRSSLRDGIERTGSLLLHNSRAAGVELDPDAAAKGVIFTSLDAAVRDHPELVKRYLFKDLVRPEEAKFTALNAAFWSGGVFLYVPEGVEVTLPFTASTWVDDPELAHFAHTIVVAERGAQVALIDEWGSPHQPGQSFSVGVTEVYAQEGARVRYMSVQNWGRQTYHIGLHRLRAAREATIDTLTTAFGGRVTKANVETLLAEPGSRTEMLGLVYGDGRQHFDHRTVQDHRAPHTDSHLLFKNVLDGRSRSVFTGVVTVRKEGQQTDSSQTCRNLLISEEARADAIPVLEIEANDVRCGHAAAIGSVEDDQVFYLMSRGIPRDEAETLIIWGFFRQLLDKIPVVGLQEKLTKTIEEKIDARGSA